ncbi:hypothetical protein L1987_20028 [Smallanthus sonchifolius]|uniref:Uncharacterized protein n=1 Tax=Smallanthus sonchifolius TaxID=185202 RepID=A0ACB9ISD5_9ASTR|nr:hypothetical protein L1987_20028 [Smallanthus sonchifolius]
MMNFRNPAEFEKRFAGFGSDIGGELLVCVQVIAIVGSIAPGKGHWDRGWLHGVFHSFGEANGGEFNRLARSVDNRSVRV